MSATYEPDGCSCHIAPPCGYCVDYCPDCKLLHDECECDHDDAVEPAPMSRPMAFTASPLLAPWTPPPGWKPKPRTRWYWWVSAKGEAQNYGVRLGRLLDAGKLATYDEAKELAAERFPDLQHPLRVAALPRAPEGHPNKHWPGCLHPGRCAGRTSCPRSLSCVD